MMLTSPTSSSSPKASPLEVLINRACAPGLPEPNYALHLEVADYINNKKANTPREASMLIAHLVNHRYAHISMLALALLDNLVQSCGYPFHLQIATKEFLNELVRRFPERPPPFPGPVMSRILDLIHGWKEGICTESRWREDLGNIRDMHRLLTFKGYRFRDLPRQPVSDIASNLKTAEELEEEDRDAQSAKLQELIRRGTPRDLAAAQELMKSLAGANPDSKPDYRSQALTDLNKLEQKVILLNEMLDNVDIEKEEKFTSGDAYDQVSSILEKARPKLQKWISDAQSDDPESLDTFLQINDQINSVLNRYEAFKRGDYATSSNPIPPELAASSAAHGLSLIDLDDTSQTPSNTSSTSDDLTGLFAAQTGSKTALTISGIGMAGGTSINTTARSILTHAPTPISSNGMGFGFGMGLPGAAGVSRPPMSPPQLSGTPPAAIMLPATPVQRPTLPNYLGNGINGPKGPVVAGGGMGMGIPQASSQPSQQQTQSTTSGTSSSNQVQRKDPFADLVGLF